LKVTQFVKNNRDDWKQLERMVMQLHKRKSKLTAKDMKSFHQLYQRASQHLSYSQTYYKDEDVTAYLNELVAKAHNLMYKEQTSSMKQLRDFFTSKFIQLLSEQWKFVIVAMFLI